MALVSTLPLPRGEQSTENCAIAEQELLESETDLSGTFLSVNSRLWPRVVNDSRGSCFGPESRTKPIYIDICERIIPDILGALLHGKNLLLRGWEDPSTSTLFRYPHFHRLILQFSLTDGHRPSRTPTSAVPYPTLPNGSSMTTTGSSAL